MLIYLIDGNNLYHSIPEIADLVEPRQALIQYIRQQHLCGSPKNLVIIVFDGFESPDVSQERTYEILFGHNKTADDVIKEKIGNFSHKGQLVVVSDDHSILDYARMEGAQVLKNRNFLDKAKHFQQQNKTKKADAKDKSLSQQAISEINKELEDIWLNKKHMHFKEIDSTHLYAVKNGAEMADKSVIIADFQTQGKGRQNRSWYSKPKHSLLLSVILKPEITPFQASLITPVLSLALLRFLETLDLKPKLKWPNDVVLNEKKIAGILAQAVLQEQQLSFVVASFGLNINQDEKELAKIDRPATSIYNETKQRYEPSQLSKPILELFYELYEKFIDKGFDALYTSWQKKMTLIGDQVLIDLGKQAMRGTILGYNPDGSVKIKDDKQEVHNFNSGEIKKLERQ